MTGVLTANATDAAASTNRIAYAPFDYSRNAGLNGQTADAAGVAGNRVRNRRSGRGRSGYCICRKPVLLYLPAYGALMQRRYAQIQHRSGRRIQHRIKLAAPDGSKDDHTASGMADIP